MDKNIFVKNLSRIVVWSTTATLAAVDGDNEYFLKASANFRNNAIELFEQLGFDKDEMVELFLAEIETIENNLLAEIETVADNL